MPPDSSSSPRRLTVLCAAKLHANQLERHLELFELVDEVERVILVRRGPLSGRLKKLDQRLFRPGTRTQEAIRFARTIHDVLRRERVDWVVGFNPIPWGSIAWSVARLHGVPTCLSLIGLDSQYLRRMWGRPFAIPIRAADGVTVTGRRMFEDAVALGVSPARLRILPHSVDTERFSPADGQYDFDVLTVGRLVPVKRMDMLIDALAFAKANGRRMRVGVLGTGPLEASLKQRAMNRGISDSVEFLGFRDDVENILRRARLFCMTSDSEGLPFALMEAMATGLVPVVTNVGTIADWIHDGENGRLIPTGDPERLAQVLIELLDDTEAWSRMRSKLIAERDALSLDVGAKVWREILVGHNNNRI